MGLRPYQESAFDTAVVRIERILVDVLQAGPFASKAEANAACAALAARRQACFVVAAP